MRKTEMSKEQLGERAAVVKTLKAAGWEPTDFNRKFERGLWSMYEASFEYDNGEVTLAANYNAEEERLELSVQTRSGRSIDFYINYEDKLQELLDVIASFQDEVSSKNYKQHVKTIVAVCPETYVATGPEGEKLVRVTDKGK